jgi:hypothetical protein
MTQTVPSSSWFHPVAGLCYVTVIFAAAPKLYLSKYGDRLHYCGICHNEIARWRATDRTTVITNTKMMEIPDF